MISEVKSMLLQGLEGYLVSIQVDISNGLPCLEIVGLPDASVKEAKERVKTAIKNTGIRLKSKRIIINLAPANTKKEGSKFDLPIAIGILISSGNVTNSSLKEFLKNTVFIGELSLDGKVGKINGILPIIIEAKKLGIKRVVLPQENIKEALLVSGIEILAVNNLKEILDYLNGNKYLKEMKNVVINFKIKNEYNLDFAEVKGQENVKRALEISAAGGHNCILIGSPGTGKTMLAQRLPSILPDITFKEALEVTKIYSIAGLTSKDTPLITTRPFRNPHHSITPTALIGGGRIIKPGEISLAHNGVLFLDELTEFNKKTLEILREPLEECQVKISRINMNVVYPCNFIFIASTNPCPCGYYGDKDKKCICKTEQIRRYLNKISGPLLDRIDLHIEVQKIEYIEFKKEKHVESSEEIRKRVNKAKRIQLERYKNENIYSNSQLTTRLIEKYCTLDEPSKSMLKQAFKKLNLSARAYTRILKVARTIADLDNQKNIQLNHLAEAIQYRSLDRKYWRDE